MKQCTTCNRQFSDDVVFCPECGSKLEAVASAPQQTSTPQQTSAPQQTYNQQTSYTQPPQPVPLWQQWIGTGLGIVGLIIEWFFSALFGFVIAVMGAVYAFKSKNAVDKALSIIFAIIAFAIYVWYMSVIS